MFCDLTKLDNVSLNCLLFVTLLLVFHLSKLAENGNCG
uniref:Uncharacterized protein n=1 Tax=Anguilla anguilla TaxID=7936 RepID=A0A0E9UKM5_ANGAN